MGDPKYCYKCDTILTFCCCKESILSEREFLEYLKATNERLRADCKDKQRLIETQKQYLDNKDSVIKGLIDMITKLEGDLEIMRLQRDATQVSRCPRCGETALQERE